MPDQALQMDAQEYKEFMQYKEFMRMKHDTQSGTPATGLYQHGGIFTYPFGNPTVFNATLQPRSFISTLPLEFSNVENEVVTIVTGMTDASGSNAANVCGDPPTPGNLKVCRVNLIFGKAFIGSKIFDTTEVGGQEFFNANPVQIQNYAMSDNVLVPEPLRVANASYFSDAARRLYELGTMYQRLLARIEIDGNSANTAGSAELGWIREFSGLSRIITDGYTDVGGNACPAADSLVENWGDTVDATVNGLTLPQLLNDMFFSRMVLAREVGMDGTVFSLEMDYRLFRQLAYQFACGFVFTRCATPDAGNPIGRTDAEVSARFEQFMNGQYLPLEGLNVPVTFTSGAEVDTSGESPVGPIFITPRSWNGRNLTVLQPFNLNNSVVQEFNQMGNTTARLYANNGMYAFATRSNGFCDQLLMVAKMRMKCWTPFLGGRIDDISFNGYVGYRNWDPAGSSFYNGGTTYYNNTMPTPM